MALSMEFFREQCYDGVKIVVFACEHDMVVSKQLDECLEGNLVLVENKEQLAISLNNSEKYILVTGDKSLTTFDTLKPPEYVFHFNVLKFLAENQDRIVNWNSKNISSMTLQGTLGLIFGTLEDEKEFSANNGVITNNLSFADYVVVLGYLNNNKDIETVLRAKVMGKPCKGKDWFYDVKSGNMINPIEDVDAKLFEGFQFYFPTHLANNSMILDSIAIAGGTIASDIKDNVVIVISNDTDFTITQRKQMKKLGCVLVSFEWLEKILREGKITSMENAYHPYLPPYYLIGKSDFKDYKVYIELQSPVIHTKLDRTMNELKAQVVRTKDDADIILSDYTSLSETDCRYHTIQCFDDWINDNHSGECPNSHVSVFVPPQLRTVFLDKNVFVVGHEMDPEVCHVRAIAKAMGGSIIIEQSKPTIYFLDTSDCTQNVKNLFNAKNLKPEDEFLTINYLYELIKAEKCNLEKELFKINIYTFFNPQQIQKQVNDAGSVKNLLDYKSFKVLPPNDDIIDSFTPSGTRSKYFEDDITYEAKSVKSTSDTIKQNNKIETYKRRSDNVKEDLQLAKVPKMQILTNETNTTGSDKPRDDTVDINITLEKGDDQLVENGILKHSGYKNESIIRIRLKGLLLGVGNSMSLTPTLEDVYIMENKRLLTCFRNGIAMYPETHKTGLLMAAMYQTSSADQAQQWIHKCQKKLTTLFTFCGFQSVILKSPKTFSFEYLIANGTLENAVVASGEIRSDGTVVFHIFVELFECIMRMETLKSTFMWPQAAIVCDSVDASNCNCVNKGQLVKFSTDQINSLEGCPCVIFCNGSSFKKVLYTTTGEINCLLPDLDNFNLKSELKTRDSTLAIVACIEILVCDNCISKFTDINEYAILNVDDATNSEGMKCSNKACTQSFEKLFKLLKRSKSL